MFRPLHSLQLRVTAALALFVAVMAALIVLTLFAINERLEHDLLDGMVAHELSELEAEYPIEGKAALPNSATIKGFVVEPDQLQSLPEPLQPLPLHTSGANLSYGGRSYRVASTVIDGKRAFLAYDTTAIESRQSVFRAALIAAVVIVFALALPLGIWIARLSLKPINQLADHVARLEPGAPGPALAERFDGYEVGAIARAFDRFMQRLDGFVERERSFTADASHELRTPLAVIQGALEVLHQDPRFADSAPLTRIERASTQMADLIESLLFLARDEDRSISSEQQCRADLVVGELLDAYKPMLGKSRVEVAALDACPLAAPRIAVVIVFGNLLRNAMRHGGPHIRVTLADGVLSVADDGPGMTAEQRRQAFERGFRHGRGAGLGLGLYLVQRVAQRYDWQLRMTSRPHEGTRVEVRFAPLGRTV
ncbi:two-component system sensor protein [Salinisphaera sp. C84B14]|uniref:sensor histidine kinase n=1 Tax=Salinisphaera sp. C84B14 TaxID=1304155 RepID=UPI0032B2A9D8